jgi:pyruvate,water dikinase
MWEAMGAGILDGMIDFESNANELKHFFGLSYQNAIMVIKKRKTETYYEIGHMKKEGEHGLEFFSNERKIEQLFAEEKKVWKTTQKFIDDFYQIDIQKVSKEELVELFESTMKEFQTVYGLYHASQPQCFEKFIDSIKNELLNLNLDELEVFLELSTPTELSIIAKENIDRKKMFIKVLKGELKEPLVKEHLKKYEYLQASEVIRPWKEKDIIESFNQNKKTIEELEEEINEQLESLEKLKQKQKETIEKNNISKELQEKFSILKHFGNSRLETRYYWSALIWPYVSCYEEIGRRNNVMNEIMDYTIEETKKLCLTGEKVDENVLKERFDFGVVLLENGKIRILSGKEAEAFVEKNIPKEEISDKVQGMTANKGTIEGIVRVITFEENIFEQMKNMKRGEILVVGQTRPFLLPAIEKASAIIADEGGITSHAAIVSREIGVPCIVNTHNATRVFKNGDKIRVDADKGIAEKID